MNSVHYFRSPDLGQAIQQFLGEERLRNQVRHFLLFSSVLFLFMITSSFIFSFSSSLLNYYFFFCLLFVKLLFVFFFCFSFWNYRVYVEIYEIKCVCQNLFIYLFIYLIICSLICLSIYSIYKMILSEIFKNIYINSINWKTV